MEEKKTRFVVYSDDYFGNSGREILGHVNTLAEAQQLLVERNMNIYRNHPEDCEEKNNEINSHTEDELVGREELTLYGSNCYFHEGIARVPGFVDDSDMVSEAITLGKILKHELASVGDACWKLEVSAAIMDFVLQVDGCDKVPVGIKYEKITGLPTHYVRNYSVEAFTLSSKVYRPKYVNLSQDDFPGVDWATVSAEYLDEIIKKMFLSNNFFYSKEDAVNSLPRELVIDRNSSGPHSIAPYDEYGYHIVSISAYHGPYGNGQGVFILIKKE